MRLGQSFHAYAKVINRDIFRIKEAIKEVEYVNMGGTAIGTAINTSPMYLHHIVENLSLLTSISFKQADDLINQLEDLKKRFAFVTPKAALLKKDYLTHGINVAIDEDNKITIDFHVIVSYGVSISTVSDNLIETVRYKVEEFTGLEIKKINIYVEGVRVID